MIFSEFEAGPEPSTSKRAVLVMRGTPFIRARDWGNSPEEFRPIQPPVMVARLKGESRLQQKQLCQADCGMPVRTGMPIASYHACFESPAGATGAYDDHSS